MSPMRWNPNKSEDQVVNEYLNVSIRGLISDIFFSKKIQ